MSEDLEKIATSIYQGRVPVAWGDVFLSEKGLTDWVEEFCKRVEEFDKWQKYGKPKVYWFSGFCFPQAFITGTLQNFARKLKVSIDRISFDFEFVDDKTPDEITEDNKEGIYVRGLFLEGAKWNNKTHLIDLPVAKELFSELPIMFLKPKVDRVASLEGIYSCPVYKVLSRRGTLSTTGHSTNFVMYIELPTDKPQSDWIKAGVASFLSLRN